MNKHLNKSNKIILSIVLLLVVSSSKPAMAWWESGHQTVAIIAENHLTNNAKNKINEILGNSTGHTVHLNEIAVCADVIKHHSINCAHDFKLKKSSKTGNWHFIDISLSEKNPTVESIEKYCVNGDCVLDQMKNEISTLKDKSASQFEKQKSLMFLVHFMGDIHQPLHCIDDEDKGGNDKEVFLYAPTVDKKMNLHSLWDNIIQENKPKENITPESLSVLLEKDILKKKTNNWLKGNTSSWTLESFNIAKNVIYANYKKNNGHLEKNYQAKMQPIAYQQIEKGGLRLAKILNDIFSAN
ncbi:MAG: S1/P1 nuclease [Candidatus Sericytochromatia bacterium]|nr:S1/P1 nuclease [Candidatus Sericytochromatia bacterium]